MKVGDIKYVKQPYTARYGRQGGSYEYHFVPGDMYEITYVHSVNSAAVQNTNGDGVPHYVDDMRERFYTLEEWRELKLKEIGI
jgi:hypothetical protein